MYVLLVCVWCSLDAGGLLMVVTAQPTVYAEILTPEADRKVGGQVDMRCTAMNLQSDHIVEWRSSRHLLRWGTTTFSTNQRFTFTTVISPEITVQNFAITDLQLNDTGVYVCNIKNSQVHIIDTSSVTVVVNPKLDPNDPAVSPPSTAWVVILAVCLVLLAVVLLVITVIVVFKVMIGGQNSDPEPTQPQTDDPLYTDLQVPVNIDIDYMIPTRPSDTNHHNHVEEEIENSDYETYEGSTRL